MTDSFPVYKNDKKTKASHIINKGVLKNAVKLS